MRKAMRHGISDALKERMVLNRQGQKSVDGSLQSVESRGSPIRLAAAPRKSRNQFIGIKHQDIPPAGIQILAHSLVEFSQWQLKRASDLFYRLYIPLSEGGLIKFGKTSIPLRPEFFYLISPRTTLITENEKPFSMWVLHFQLGDMTASPGDTPLPTQDTVYEIKPTSDLLRLLEKACPKRTEDDSHSPCVPFLSVLELIIHTLRTSPSQNWEIKIRDNRVPALLELARENLSKHGVLDILRNAAGLDRTQLYRLFVAETGFSPMHFLTEMRLDHATDLLRNSTLSAQEVAAASGFLRRAASHPHVQKASQHNRSGCA